MKNILSSNQALLNAGVNFHGHLGPYLVLGLRMGTIAVDILKPKGLHGLSVRVWTRTRPPYSCVLDGIQVSSGCTLGKGSIWVRKSERTRAVFCDGKRTLVIEPTKKAAHLLSQVTKHSPPRRIQEIAITVRQMRDEELFNCLQRI
jgi:formylmethanofuran dehydrogenase subunit E